MAEYIDRKSLIDEFDRLGLGEHSVVERVFSDGVRTIIAGIPAADVVAVVRCEQCAHSYDDISGRCCIYADGPVKDDFFCGYGERNEVILGGLEAGGG